MFTSSWKLVIMVGNWPWPTVILNSVLHMQKQLDAVDMLV